MTTAPSLARVAVEVEPFHLDRPFDYAVPDGMEVGVGSRVEVVLAGRRVRGLVLALPATTDVDPARLRPLRRVLGSFAWADEDDIALWRWAAGRFGAPFADVVRHALPGRVIDVERRAEAAGWFPPGRAPRPPSDPAPDLDGWSPYAAAGEALLAAVSGGRGSFHWRPLAGEDVGARVGELVQLALAGDRDALIIVPDPSSPVADAVVRLAADAAIDLRGTLTPRVHYGRWLAARCGTVRVVIGERGGAFVPLTRLGLAIVIDEANPAHKERRSPRHNVREVVLERARRAGGVGLTIGTVPSAILQGLLDSGRVSAVTAPRATIEERRPRIVVATGEGEARARISRASVQALRRATRAGHYGVVLATRRGEGAALVCRDCGERVACPVCSASVSHDGDAGGSVCGACGHRTPQAPRCPSCASTDLVPLAAGARRLADEIARTLDAPVAVLEGYASLAPPAPAVLVMTRGSVLDAPPGRVGAVVLPDLDAALARPTLDAAEDTVRLAFALAAWLRTEGPVDVRTPTLVIETRQPEHHAVRALVEADPDLFWREERARRAPLRFPPSAHALRIEVRGPDDEVVRALAAGLAHGDEVLGPLPTDEGRAYLVKADDRDATLAALAPLRQVWSRAGLDVRVEVDPVTPG